MDIYEARLNDALLERLISFSADWEAEDSTYGYRKNGRGDIEGNRIFLAEQDGRLLGYLFGQEAKAERATSIMADGTPYFEVEELYVIPEFRNQGVGRALFQFVEQELKAAGIEPVGAGKDIEEARKPVIKVLEDGTKIGFLAYCSILPQDYWATENRPGCAPLRGITAAVPTEHDQPETPVRLFSFPHPDDLDAMLEVMLKPELTEFQYLVSGDDWTVRLR